MGDRHSFRAKWHSYDKGIYFVTICTFNKRHTLGYILSGEMHLSELGEITSESIADLPNHHNVDIHAYVVMPNHIHIVLQVGAWPATPASSASNMHQNKGCLRHSCHGKECSDFHHNASLPTIIGSLKAAVTRKYRNQLAARGNNNALTVWQRLFHEHIIRNQRSYDTILNYVIDNVSCWEDDTFHSD